MNLIDILLSNYCNKKQSYRQSQINKMFFIFLKNFYSTFSTNCKEIFDILLYKIFE